VPFESRVLDTDQRDIGAVSLIVYGSYGDAGSSNSPAQAGMGELPPAIKQNSTLIAASIDRR
jgi:hypothetical protein